MQPSDILAALKALLNLPDLIILAILLVNMILGFYRGLIGSLFGLASRLITLAASFFAARAAAPVVAKWIVTPIVGSVFENQAQLGEAGGLLDGLRQNVTEAAVSMAESIAFLLLLLLFFILIGSVLGLVLRAARAVAKATPLGILDSVAGGAVGLATGLVVIALLLVGIQWVSPITYSQLGYLSPERVSHTFLLAKFIDFLPVAI